MKTNFINKIVGVLALSTVAMTSANAQLVGGNTFLQGPYIEVGVAQNGAYGSTVNAPAGYHPRGSGTQLGFVADPALDGWAVGVPNYIGCYFLPGVPQEGWDMSINGTWFRAYRDGSGGGGTGYVPGGSVTGSNGPVTYEGANVTSTWTGAIGNLAIEQKTYFDTNNVYFFCDVKLKNTGTTTIENIFYSRTLDPDNESAVPGGGGPSTFNEIHYQPDEFTGDYRALVSATGNNFPSLSYLGIGAIDCRATVYIYPPALYPSTGPHTVFSPPFQTGKGWTNSTDCAIGIVFNIGDLEPGDSTTFTFTYVLSSDQLDTAFSNLTAGWIIDGDMYPSPSDTLDYVICRNAGDSLDIEIAGGAAFVWGDWTPTTGLAYPSGRTNRVEIPHNTTTYRVIGTTTICPVSDTVYLRIIPVGDTAVINAEICQGSLYDFGGTPVYNSGTYYKVFPSAISGCDSVSQLNLTVNPLPGVDISVDNNNICDNESAIFNVLNPSPNSNYQWYRDGSAIPGANNSTYIAPPIPGVYRVVGVTNKGCVDTSRAITLRVNPAAEVEINSVDFGKVCMGDTVTISVNALPGYEYYWSPEKAFRYTSGNRQSIVQGVMNDEITNITVKGINQYGCIAYDEITVIAIPCCEIAIPTAFSPNNDGLNDYFNIILQTGQKIVTFQIFDRLGNMVYDNQNPKKGWNGQVNNSGDHVAQAVYFYRIVYSCTDGENYETKGDITLVR